MLSHLLVVLLMMNDQAYRILETDLTSSLGDYKPY